jgi:hypothetical protein
MHSSFFFSTALSLHSILFLSLDHPTTKRDSDVYERTAQLRRARPVTTIRRRRNEYNKVVLLLDSIALKSYY